MLNSDTSVQETAQPQPLSQGEKASLRAFLGRAGMVPLLEYQDNQAREKYSGGTVFGALNHKDPDVSCK
jgi:hypothetical protein